MSIMLLSELARANAAANQRIAQSLETAAQRGDEPQPPKDHRPALRQKTRDARQALRYTLAQAAEVNSLWHGTITVFEDGLEGDEARALLDVVLQAIASWFGLMKSTRDLWQTASGAGTTAEELKELDAAQHDVDQSRKTAQDMRDFLSRARPPVDADVLEHARQAMTLGRFSSAEAVRARLCQGQG